MTLTVTMSVISKIQPLEVIDLESNVVSYNRPRHENSNFKICMIFCILTFIFVIVLCPFIVTDLYFAYSYEDKCLSITPDAINLTLSTWLKVDAFITLGTLLFIIVLFMCFQIDTNSDSFTRFSNVIVCFVLSWTIVGSILSWNYLKGLCSKPIDDYMYARLIIYFISIIGVLFNSKKSKK